MLTAKLNPPKLFDDPINKLLIGLIALCLVLQFFMVLRFEINQDEFYSLMMAYEFTRGEVSNPFQTIFFRLSTILQHVPGNEVDQVIAGRMVIFAFAVLTCVLIYKTSRRFYSAQASLFAVLAFFAFNYVFRHMTAYRADMVITTILMAIIWLVSDPAQNWKKVVTTGFLIGLTFTFALKSIFYMPIVAVFLVGRWMSTKWSRQAFLYGAVMFVIAVLTYALLYVLHSTSMSGSEYGTNYLKKVSFNGLVQAGLFNRGYTFLFSLFNNVVGWSLLFVGFFTVIAGLGKNRVRTRIETAGLVSLIIPLTTVIYYYHTNPYFYPFMLAPAMIFIAAAADKFLVGKRALIFAVFISYFCFLAGSVFVRSMSQTQDAQRATLDAIHELFPSPVPYIDYCGAISSFDRLNESRLFMNPDIFAHSKYLRDGQPMMTEFLKTYQPQIMLANVEGLDLADDYEDAFDYVLLEPDDKVLRDSFIKFWGPIYLPGKQVFSDGPIEILIDGTYTIYGSDETQIDGVPLRHGDVVLLSPGTHQVTQVGADGIKLVWGDNLQKPTTPEPMNYFFNGF